MPIDPTSTGSVSQKDLIATSPNSGTAGSVNRIAVPITQAQLQAMNTTPVPLTVGIPGSYLVPLNMAFFWKGTGAGGTAANVRIGWTAHPGMLFIASVAWGNVINWYYPASMTGNYTGFIGEGLVADAQSAPGAILGSGVVIVDYTVVT